MSAAPAVRVVDTAADLVDALAALESLDMVGVDVERADWDRYFRAAALIQVGGVPPSTNSSPGAVPPQAVPPDATPPDATPPDAGCVVLVDPFGIPDLAPLGEFLSARVTVLHAMDNDLPPLETAGVAPGKVEDTAVAAAILGLPTGLGDLLESQLGVTLAGDKQAMQRADWAQRPLTDDMQRYAADDVVHLPRLWAALEDQLHRAGRFSWYTEERDWVRSQPSAEERRHWTRTRGVGRLDASARARARSLWEIREQLARDTDTAPGRILADRMIVDLAIRPVTAARELARRGMRRSAVRQFGRHVLDALHEPQQMEAAAKRRRTTEDDRARIDKLRTLRSTRARELGIDAGILCPNRVLGTAVHSRPETPQELRQALELRDWQWQQVGAAFCEALDLDGPGKPAAPVPDGNAPAAEGAPQEISPRHERSVRMDVLNPDALHHELDRLPGWSGTTEGISRTFILDDFASAIRFVDAVAEHAERAGHHPDIAVSWNEVTLTYVTHSAGGVTQADVEQAREVTDLAPGRDPDDVDTKPEQ